MAACRARARCMRSSHVAYASPSFGGTFAGEAGLAAGAMASVRTSGGSRPLSDELMTAPETVGHRLRVRPPQRRNWFTGNRGVRQAIAADLRASRTAQRNARVM